MERLNLIKFFKRISECCFLVIRYNANDRFNSTHRLLYSVSIVRLRLLTKERHGMPYMAARSGKLIGETYRLFNLGYLQVR